jgi:Ser/Thr protein kinase RdoA (MazF antagonist)
VEHPAEAIDAGASDDEASAPDRPRSDVLARFAVREVAPLGGRLNRHWLVEPAGPAAPPAVAGRLVLRRWAAGLPPASLDYERRLLERLAALGWPVAPVVAGPIERGGHAWSLSPFLPGEPPSQPNNPDEQRARGRLLAALHQDLARLTGFGQRPPWRRCEAILADPALDRVLADHEIHRAEEVRLLRWHLDRARERIAPLRRLAERPGMVIHGDFTSWNLRFLGGSLSGILDFELAHEDHRVGDFALAWRGKYDEVVRGYDDVSPLEPQEWELLTPLWWAGLIELACEHLRAGTADDGWILKKLLERSPLMGTDAVAFP